ncbi:MAG: hypothetical protein INF43_03535 [Alphaproteobacteria bacterium]|nr:hypothetical protein [Alphaproteobacteria bacterium]
MDPRYRFTLVISCLLIAWWLWVVVTTFLIGPTGLNWARYQQGVFAVGGAVLAGFAVVWLATQLIAWQRQRKTGFEAEPTDEFGTAFEMLNANGQSESFNMALSKFQPTLVAPPAASAQLHPLEAELLGFLQGFQHWPLDPAKPEITLYEQATARWQVMRHIPGSGPWHRVAALAKDLAVVHALEEQRTPPPWYQFGARDVVRFRRRTVPNPGMSALILSTLPAFRALQHQPEGPATQRALLTALRYAHIPQQLPLNAGPLAATLVEGLTRAEAQLGLIDITELDQLTPARKEALESGLAKAWLAALDHLTPQADLTPTTTLYRSAQPGGTPLHWVELRSLLAALGPAFDPELRTVLGLWDLPADDPRHHRSWATLGPLLQERDLIADTAYSLSAEVGTFMLSGPNQQPWGPCVLLNLTGPQCSPLQAKWQSLPTGPLAELALSPASLQRRAESQLQSIDTKLREAF